MHVLCVSRINVKLSCTRRYFATEQQKKFEEEWRSTTILCIRKGSKVTMIGDGQVSRGSTVLKGNALKVRRIRKDILVGMAGAVGDCLALIERLEKHLDETAGNLTRACVSLAKAWRTEKYLRELNATLCVADPTVSLMVTGNGDVIEPADGIMAIGSGGTYALACAKGLIDLDDMDSEEIAKKSMKIAADICVYTNQNFVVETLQTKTSKTEEL